MVGVQNEKSFKKNGFQIGIKCIFTTRRLRHHTLTFFQYHPHGIA